MKSETIVAIVLSIIVIAVSALVILALEPSNKTVPYFHDKTVEEVESYILSIKSGENSSELLFNDLKSIDEDTLKYIMGIEPQYLEGYSVMTSKEDATTIFILRLKEGSKSLIEKSVLDYMDYLEKQWKNTDNSQAELIQNFSKVSYGNYLIYTISNNNEYFKTQIDSLFIYADK